ncbi:rhodanese-like domain-containing protein [bacterium]|nr:rhodanese-like domain-containing protein [bacterium]
MPIQQITPPEAKAALDADPSAVYLDVRTEMEFAMGHPTGAINVPIAFPDSATGGMRLNSDFLAVVQKVLSRDKPIFCGCQAGQRSQMAAQVLVQAGYTNVTNVQGGFGGSRDTAGWKAAGLPVSSDTGDDVSYAGLRKKAGL